MLKNYLIFIVLILISQSAFSAYTALTTGATISEIASNTGNGQNFFITVTGGTGPCTGTSPTLIVFPLSNSGTSGNDENLHNRAFTLALTAYSIGHTIEVGGYEGQDCQTASRIKIVK